MRLFVLAILLIQSGITYSQQINCDDFTTYNWQPNGDTLGYTQGTHPIMNVPYFNDTNLGQWNYNMSASNPGMYGATTGASFSFDGSNQVITYEIYGFYNQYDQMGFSVNGSAPVALNGTFPVTIGSITVDLDTSAVNLPNWENAYLSFTGNVNEIQLYAFESGIIKMCVEEDTTIQPCDDFTTYNWQPNGDTLGYTQGTHPIINVPYFNNIALGQWYYNMSASNPGMYGATSGASFSFDGSNQVITYEIYGFYNQYDQMGFSVNGSAPVALNGNFPVTIGGITVDLDTSAVNLPNWENAYLSFTGNVNEIRIYAFESGIIKMCVDSGFAAINNDFDYNFNNVTIYPNPAHDKFNITGLSDGMIEIYNIQGQIVEIINTFKTLATIDISKLSVGIYTIRIKTDEGFIVKKLIKQ